MDSAIRRVVCRGNSVGINIPKRLGFVSGEFVEIKKIDGNSFKVTKVRMIV